MLVIVQKEEKKPKLQHVWAIWETGFEGVLSNTFRSCFPNCWVAHRPISSIHKLIVSLHIFPSKHILGSFVHFSTTTWVSTLSLQHKTCRHHRHYRTSLKKILHGFSTSALLRGCRLALIRQNTWFHILWWISMSTISSCVRSVCSTSQLADSPTESDLIQICLEQLPPNSKMSSLTLRDGLRHDPSLQGAQISTVWQRGLNGGGLGGGMRWKLKGGMARSAVILPQATSYADPARPGFGTRLLGKRGVFPPFRVMFRSVPLLRPYIHTEDKLTSPH